MNFFLRINRYIMECKYHTVRGRCCRIMELIDTLWNVNSVMLYEKFPMEKELIDTLWNVNFSDPDLDLYLKYELIDTLWNVNEYHINNDENYITN